jgi:hypothetical protein
MCVAAPKSTILKNGFFKAEIRILLEILISLMQIKKKLVEIYSCNFQMKQSN